MPVLRPSYFALIAAVGILLHVTPVVAHHAFAAEYDANKPVTLRGTVTKVEWVNPHAWIYIDVKDTDGKVVPWKIETGAPNALIRRGFKRDSIPVGSEILVDGYQAKNGSNMVNGKSVTFADGKNLFVGSSGTGAPVDPERK
jgi:hypothetical protein